MKKAMALLLGALLVLFSLAGCSGGSASSQSQQSVASVSEAGSASAGGESESLPEIGGSGGNLEAIKASGKLVMITNATFPPFEYLDINGVSGVGGVDVALAKLVAEKIGVELEVVNMNFDLLVNALQNGKGDIAAAGMTITDERKEAVDFSVPYVDTTLMILVPTDSTISGPDDLNGLIVAVQEGTTSDLFVSDPTVVEPKEILRFKNAVDAGGAVINGKADAAVIDEMTAKNILENNQDKLVLLDEPLGVEQYAMAMAKGNDDLMAVVNEVLQEAVEQDLVNQLIAEHMALTAG